MSALSTPILFLIFNRPDTTELVFKEIKKQKPKFLFVAADGPRSNIPSDVENCEIVRQLIIENIDWDCTVKTLFREENLGCGKAVSEAISWFFEQVEAGIILEDDCLPDSTFFPYCEELLERFLTDEKVMSISGSNLLGKPWKSETQSYFSGHVGIWGWATWRRAWKCYDWKMKDWKDDKTKEIIKSNLKTDDWFKFYYPMFESSFNGSLDTWDVQWVYTVLINNGAVINPCVNLVKNIGFGITGTHTHSEDNFMAKLSTAPISFPLNHPNIMEVDIDYLNSMYYTINRSLKVRFSIIKKIIRYISSKTAS